MSIIEVVVLWCGDSGWSVEYLIDSAIGTALPVMV